jgi:hypothetical protein
MTDPIDRAHADSMEAIEWVRSQTNHLKTQAANWQPGPMPDEWREVKDVRLVVWRSRR